MSRNNWSIVLDSGERIDSYIFDYLLDRREAIPDSPDPMHMNLSQILDAFTKVVTEDLLANGRMVWVHVDRNSSIS
jgi:hypothetical protein